MTELPDLWRRLLDADAPDRAAAARLTDAALRAAPSLADALQRAPDHDRVLVGHHRCPDNAALQALRGVRVLVGHLEVGPAVTDLGPLRELTFVQRSLTLRGPGSPPPTSPPPTAPPLELPALTAVGGRLELRDHPRLTHVHLPELRVARAILLHDVPLYALAGFDALRRCDDLRVLLEPHTRLTPEALAELTRASQVLLLRYVACGDGRWYLRRLFSGEATPGWLETACERDADGSAEDGHVQRDEGALRPPGRALIGLLGCNLRGRARFIAPIFEGHNVIGRSADAELRIQSPHIAGKHCVLRHEAGITAAVDMGSTNGTWLSGARIDRGELRDGAALRVADVEARFWTLHGR